MISDLAKHLFRSSKFYFVWYTQQLILADTTFSVPRSSSYTHQVSDCHSQSVPHLSLSFLCRIFLILDKLKTEMTTDSLHHPGKNGEHYYGENLHNATKNGEHSCVKNFHGDNLNPHNINELSCTHQSQQETQHLCHSEHCLIFVGPEHQHSCVEIPTGNSTKRHIKSNQHMYNPHAFNKYVKTILNHCLSLSEVDLGDLKRESTKHGPSLMEVDWGETFEPNYTSCGCMLMQVDWGGKLRVNHINECMPSEVGWGGHETHQNGPSITKVDWGGHDPIPYPMDGCMLSEDDWGAHDSSFFLYLMHIDHDAKPRISSPKNCGEDYHKGHLPPLSWST